MLYQAYQLQSDVNAPLRLMSQIGSAVFGLGNADGGVLRKVSAALDVFSRLRLTHSRPDYGIHAVTLGEDAVRVQEEVVLDLPFGRLLHFKKNLGAALENQPKVLLVAPLSGHFATLLRETVRTLLQDHDVYITD
jgi:poly(3-hydroxybutyrate) depolymerase